MNQKMILKAPQQNFVMNARTPFAFSQPIYAPAQPGQPLETLSDLFPIGSVRFASMENPRSTLKLCGSPHLLGSRASA